MIEEEAWKNPNTNHAKFYHVPPMKYQYSGQGYHPVLFIAVYHSLFKFI